MRLLKLFVARIYYFGLLITTAAKGAMSTEFH
jgi:hypothetical protein